MRERLRIVQGSIDNCEVCKVGQAITKAPSGIANRLVNYCKDCITESAETQRDVLPMLAKRPDAADERDWLLDGVKVYSTSLHRYMTIREWHKCGKPT